jgi:molecular chaperone GrpE
MRNKHEVQPTGEPLEQQAASDALHDDQDIKTAQAAKRGEEIAAAEGMSAHAKAKQLRKLSDDELLALADQAGKADHWLDVARRGQAELENTIKRLRRDQQDATKYAASGLARDLLPVIDNLARALEAAVEVEDLEGLQDGVRLTYKLFTDVLARHDITAIDSVGKPFDPAVHEAVLMDNQPKLDDNVITAEFEKGWKMHDRVLRAAKVRVNKR